MIPSIIHKVISEVNGEEFGEGIVKIGSDCLIWIGTESRELTLNYSCIKRYGWSTNGALKELCFKATFKITFLNERNIICLSFQDIVSFVYVIDSLLFNVNLDPVPSECWNDSVSSIISQQPVVSFKHLTTHVTCIRFINELVFAGVGDTLRVFAYEGHWQCLISKKIFNGQNIYGIVNSEDDILLYGGQTASLIRYLSTSNAHLRIVVTFRTQDWIIDCIWLEDQRQIALLTANNALLRYDLASYNPRLISCNTCSERCILYSGKLLNKSWNEIIVLAGTVFATIIVWSNAPSETSKQIIHQLKGHKGVIFSINFCERSRLICSTSDDRSARVWCVDYNGSTINWHNCKISLKHSLFGHLARVWKSCFTESCIVTVGEDSRVCVWNLDGTLHNQWEGHQGGEIWSIDSNGRNQLVTGGSDGGIVVWPLTSVPAAQILPFHKGTIPRCLSLTTSGTPFMVDDLGQFFLYKDDAWVCCMHDVRFSSYCLLSVSPNRTMVAFVNISGCLLVCEIGKGAFKKVIDSLLCDGRIFSLLWLSNNSLVTCESNGVVCTWDLNVESNCCQKRHQYSIPLSKERWITSAAEDEVHFVCGDRGGSLYLYKLETENPKFTLKKVHGHSGVTDVKLFGGKVLSTGRDGKYREFMIKDDKLLLVTCCKLKLDWAAAIVDCEPFQRILICFHDVFLIIWSMEERRPILKIDCGGGHRSWDCLIDHSTNCMSIAYIKGKSIYFCRVPINNIMCHTVQFGIHPKPINTALVLPNFERCVTDQRLLLGAEDTTVRCLNLNESSQEQSKVLQSHLSSIRTVTCFVLHEKSQTFIATGGGRGQLVLWKVLSMNDGNSEFVELISYCVMAAENSKNENQLSICDVAEMRIMDIQFYEFGDNKLKLVLGCSDGVLRFLCYNLVTNTVNVNKNISLDHCILKVLVVPWQPDLYIMTTTTRGVMQLYSTSEMSHCLHTSFAIADSGINSCDHKRVGDHLIVSCAGDSAIVNVLLLCLNETHWQMKQHYKNVVAHSCQISGMKMINSWLFSTGLDQILSVFSWRLVDDILDVSLMKKITLSIPDIHGTLAWSMDNRSCQVFVYGLGTQLLQIIMPD